MAGADVWLGELLVSRKEKWLCLPPLGKHCTTRSIGFSGQHCQQWQSPPSLWSNETWSCAWAPVSAPASSNRYSTLFVREDYAIKWRRYDDLWLITWSSKCCAIGTRFQTVFSKVPLSTAENDGLQLTWGKRRFLLFCFNYFLSHRF